MLLIQITKRPDGAGLLRCVRSDGSTTWQKQERHAAFFALHDLTHFAVESTLGFQRGFFGLITEGWDLEDTTGKGVRGPLPPEAVEVEHIVGLLDQERASGTILTAEEFNEYAATHPALRTEQLARVRARRGELFSRWFALAPGETLELQFYVTTPAARSPAPA